jgi:F-type H+-transporting ATPase subunit alpha
LRQLLKQPQNSPLAVWEQVAISYAGLNGYIDTIAVDRVVEFSVGLREYLKTNKAKYVEIINTAKALTDEAEALLKEGIKEFTQAFGA